MKVLRRLRAHTGPIFFWIFGIAIVATPLIGVSYVRVNWPTKWTDQLALVGVVSTVGAAWLAFLAALVALLAYALADEKPDLSVLLDGKPLEAGFDLNLANPTADRYEVVAPRYLIFRLVNHSGFSARNPAVRVNFTEAMAVDPGFSPQWGVTYRTGDDISVQWSGGADISVHGHWEQNAPPLNLVGSTATWVRQGIGMTVEVVAEGFRLPAQKVPIRIHRIPTDDLTV